MHLKPNAAAQFKQTLESEVLPLLRRRQGFQDELVLIAPDGREAIGISLWDNQQHAEAYSQQSYSEVQQILSKVCTMISRATVIQKGCSERERFLDLLKDANQELMDIHAAEMAAAILGNFVGFDALQTQLAFARRHRDEIARDLKRHMTEHSR